MSASKRHLDPRVLAELKPFATQPGEGTKGYWRFNSYVEELEDRYWNPDLVLSEQVKFLLALVPNSLRGSVKKSLGDMEHNFLSSHGYSHAPDDSYHAPEDLFFAPISKMNCLYPELEGSDEAVGVLTYKHYKDHTLLFICGDFGADDCFESLQTLKQNGTDIRAHVEDWRRLFELYVRLSNPNNSHSMQELTLFSALFYKSLDEDITQNLVNFPNDLESAYQAAIEMSRTNKKRRALAPPASSSDSLLRSSSKVHRARSSQVNVNEVASSRFPVSPGATLEVRNMSSYLESAAHNGVKLLSAVCEVCHLKPNVSSIVKSTSCKYDALRAGVRSALRDNHTLDEAVNAIRNLVPTKYTVQSSSSKQESSEYDNLNELSMDELKNLHKKRKLIESLRAKTTYDSLSDDESEAKAEPASRQPRTTRASKRGGPGAVHNLQTQCDDDAHIHTVAAFSVELNAIQRSSNCLKCKAPGHYWKDCPSLIVDGQRMDFCPYCKEAHPLSTCPHLASVHCKECGGQGHTKRFCPKNACPKCNGPHPISQCTKFGGQ